MGAAGGSVGAAGGRELADGWCDGPLPRVVDVADGAIVGTDGAAGGREPTPDGRRDGASDGDAEGRVDGEPTEEGSEDPSGIGDGRELTEEGEARPDERGAA